jgi:hypothetical protein
MPLTLHMNDMHATAEMLGRRGAAFDKSVIVKDFLEKRE